MKLENIKFKAKSIYNGEWIYGDLLHKTDGTHIYMGKGESGHILCPRVDPSTVCQFTGEKDMNGTEIYIGDIIFNLETRSVIEVVWNDRLKRLDCKFISGANSRLDVPFGIFISRHKRIIVLISKFDKEE